MTFSWSRNWDSYLILHRAMVFGRIIWNSKLGRDLMVCIELLFRLLEVAVVAKDRKAFELIFSLRISSFEDFNCEGQTVNKRISRMETICHRYLNKWKFIMLLWVGTRWGTFYHHLAFFFCLLVWFSHIVSFVENEIVVKLFILQKTMKAIKNKNSF